MTEWLSLMMDEIRRKERERDEAVRERQRRETDAAHDDATPAIPGPSADDRERD